MDDTSVRIKQELRSMNERLKKLDPVLSITKDSVQDLTSQLAKTSQQLSSSLKSALGGSQGSGQAAAISGLAGLESAVTSLSSQLPGLVGAAALLNSHIPSLVDATVSLREEAVGLSVGISTLSTDMNSLASSFTSQGSGNQFTADELASKIAKAISDEKDKDDPGWVKKIKDHPLYKNAKGAVDIASPFADIIGSINDGFDLTNNIKEFRKNRKEKKAKGKSGGDSSAGSSKTDSSNSHESSSTSKGQSDHQNSTTSNHTGGPKNNNKPKGSPKAPKGIRGLLTKVSDGTKNIYTSVSENKYIKSGMTGAKNIFKGVSDSNIVNKSKSGISNLFKGGKGKKFAISSLVAAGGTGFGLFANSKKAQAAADEPLEEDEATSNGQYTNPVAQAAQTAINTVQTGRDLAATASTASSALSWTKKILTGAKVVNKVSRFARFTPMGLIGGFALDAGIYAAEKWLLPKLEKNTKKEEELTEEQIRKNAEQMRAFKEAANQAASTSNPGFQHTIPPTFGTLPASSNVPTPSPTTTPAQGQNTTDASPEPSAPKPQPHPGMLATPPAATFSTKPYTSMETPMEPVSAPPAANSNASARTIPQTVDVNANSQVVMNLNVNGYIDRKMIEEIKRICREQYESAFRSFERGITSKVPLPPPVSKGGMMSY